MISEPTLIGYLLGALDPDEKAAVEAFLAADPENQQTLAQLRRAIGPLQLDREHPLPPPDLVMRTIAAVAEVIVTTEHRAHQPDDTPVSDFLRTIGYSGSSPASSTADAPTPPPPTSRRPPQSSLHDVPLTGSVMGRNVIAAIGLSLALIAIGVPAVFGLRHQRNLDACKNNFREYHQAFSRYADTHQDRFPQVPDHSPAGTFLLMLDQAQVLPAVSPTCPGTGTWSSWNRSTDGGPSSLPSKIDYSYTLGYHGPNQEVVGIDRNMDNLEHHPLLSDAPVRKNGTAEPVNHRRFHQVLFINGNVRTTRSPLVGVERDNIFYDVDRGVGAGKHAWDSVLGRPEEEP